MRFNSAQFIFGFLPVVLAGFFVLGRLGFRQLAIAWMLAASLVFYGWDDPFGLIPIIVVSGIFNFCIGRELARLNRPWLLALGIGGNLLWLGYFKYASFLLQNLGTLTGLPLPQPTVSLPLGISFYTLTQIAFLIDTYRKQAREYEPLKFGLFVTYFPHLVAGPILHHKEIMPQFDDPSIFRLRLTSLAHGLAWFAAGLFKKVVLADGIAAYADTPFKAAATSAVGFADAWISVLSYTLQIYFDFSGYSDMAIGLALMIGITFPLNFNSPYKACSLIEFWRRWHMTLSRFLRDDLYFPLGGNRRGRVRRHVNLMITMAVGGLWHGASWNFVVWGCMHGIGLILNHVWRDVSVRKSLKLPLPFARGMTLLAVVFAWVPFRAESFQSTLNLWRGMTGFEGPGAQAISNPLSAAAWISTLSAIALAAPNTQEIFALDWRAGTASSIRWQPSTAWALITGGLFGVAIAEMLSNSTTFLYFRF